MSGTSQTPRAPSLTIPKGFLKYIFLCKYILVKPQAVSQFCFQRALMKRLASPGSGGGQRLSRAMCRGCRQRPGGMQPKRESALPPSHPARAGMGFPSGALLAGGQGTENFYFLLSRLSFHSAHRSHQPQKFLLWLIY